MDTYAINLGLAWSDFLKSFIQLTPPLVFIFSISTISVVFVGKMRKNQKKMLFIHILFYGILGMSVAYLTNLSSDTILKGLLPSLILTLTFFFQLLGRTLSSGRIPIRGKAMIMSGMSCAFSFTLCLMYFSRAL